MYRYQVFALIGCVISIGVSAQNIDLQNVLSQIEQNNKELQALSNFVESKQTELKLGNNLPNPEVGGYYLPFGDHSSGDYFEFEVSQSFEFPSIYATRGNLIEAQSTRMQLHFASKRQEILWEAKNQCIELVYLKKKLAAETLRATQAEKLFDLHRELHAKGAIGILELNKAQLAWLQQKFKSEQLEAEINNVKLLLNVLNGGKELDLPEIDYDLSLTVGEPEMIWSEKLESDPELLKLVQDEEIAQNALRLSRQQSLPSLTAGYNQQGVSGEMYSGIFAGISIPLWNSREKVSAARSLVEYQEEQVDSELLKAHLNFQKQFKEYQLLLTRFEEYALALSAMNSESLLLQGYESGEFSFNEYYTELQFYRQAKDIHLEMEYRLSLYINSILRHQL